MNHRIVEKCVSSGAMKVTNESLIKLPVDRYTRWINEVTEILLNEFSRHNFFAICANDIIEMETIHIWFTTDSTTVDFTKLHSKNSTFIIVLILLVFDDQVTQNCTVYYVEYL